ncbi:MAG: flagellar hook-length control protein FliK [Telluria sp.]
MQTSPLPNLAAGVNANAAPQRAGSSSSDAGDGQFSAALSREIDQRSEAAPAQQQPAQQRAGKSGTSPKPVQAPAQPPAQAPAQDAATAAADSAAGLPGKLPAQADAASAQDDPATGDSAASQQAADPMADMLALVANYNQLLKQGSTAPRAAPADGASAAQAMPGATLAPAGLPSDQAIAAIAGRFASQMKGADTTSAPTGAPVRAAIAQASGKGAGAVGTQTAQEPLSSIAPSSAPSAAPTGAPGAEASLSPSAAPGLAPTLGPTFAPTGAPSAAPAEFSAHLASAQPDAAAAQLLAATAAPTIAPIAAQLVGAGDKISARVGTSAWDEQVGQKIVWMVGGGEQSASLTLNPPDLGPMQVVLSVSGDQASVAFSSAHQDVRHALENALPRLREMMDQSGLSLGSATVSAGNPGQGQGQAQGQWQGGGGSGTRFGMPGADTAAATEAVEAPRARRTTLVGDNGMVDTFA